MGLNRLGLMAAVSMSPKAFGIQSRMCQQVDDVMLNMTLEDFDVGDGGWRSLDTVGCESVAADGIARYRERHTSALSQGGLMLWHEAQLRAAAGQTGQAIELMLQVRQADGPEFDPYTDATIAFLRRDRTALTAARQALVALPEPAAFRRAADRFASSYPDLPPLTWPLNLDVVDGLIVCFDRPYREAYVCRPEARNVQGAGNGRGPGERQPDIGPARTSR